MLLKLAEHDEERELEFELDFQATLTVEERYRMMIEHSNAVREMLRHHGHIEPVEVLKRT